MSADVQERVFEPFFTTKEVGQGTGLGLSMVFGFAKQSGGHVALSSEVGGGTTVRLYLPRAAQRDHVVVERNLEAPSAQGESILLVEDDEDLRILVTSMLQKLGYQYTIAEDGDAAISAMSTMPNIDLLVSDIVLPGGKSGPDIPAVARQRFPEVKVLFMSGYPRGALSGANQLDESVLLLEKPFRMADLALNIRKALGTE